MIKWVLAATVIGICCICLLGRPGSDQSSPFSWTYTQAPTTAPLATLGADLKSIVASSVPTVAPVPTAALTITALPTAAGTAIVEPTIAANIAALTTAPAPFVSASIVGKTLREGIASLAKNVPGVTIRPFAQGTSLPPGVPNANRISVAYDPATLNITSVQSG